MARIAQEDQVAERWKRGEGQQRGELELIGSQPQLAEHGGSSERRDVRNAIAAEIDPAQLRQTAQMWQRAQSVVGSTQPLKLWARFH